jgi:hypothetical protein
LLNRSVRLKISRDRLPRCSLHASTVLPTFVGQLDTQHLRCCISFCADEGLALPASYALALFVRTSSRQEERFVLKSITQVGNFTLMVMIFQNTIDFLMILVSYWSIKKCRCSFSFFKKIPIPFFW